MTRHRSFSAADISCFDATHQLLLVGQIKDLHKRFIILQHTRSLPPTNHFGESILRVASDIHSDGHLQGDERAASMRKFSLRIAFIRRLMQDLECPTAARAPLSHGLYSQVAARHPHGAADDVYLKL